MKQLFYIENDKSENEQRVLSLRLGNKHAGFSITSKSGAALHQLAYCSSLELDETELNEFIGSFPSLNDRFFDILISYDYAQSILVPSKEYRSEDSGLLVNILNGNTDNSNIISELIDGWQLYNSYSVPKNIQEWVAGKFPTAKFRHQYSLGIKNIDAKYTSGNIIADFRHNEFTIIAARENKLLLAQTYEYSTPADVLYYLLKVCQQYSLSQQELQLQLSGLIDKQSPLYKELYQYFINVDFKEPNWNAGDEYPAHYFTSLNELAKCAS